MRKHRQDGILILEEISSLLEEMLTLSKITVNNKEKDIHREIREVFQLKTKTEQLIAAVSSLYNIFLEIETEQESVLLWKESPTPSSQIKQRIQNRESLVKYLEAIKFE